MPKSSDRKFSVDPCRASEILYFKSAVLASETLITLYDTLIREVCNRQLNGFVRAGTEDRPTFTANWGTFGKISVKPQRDID